MNRTKFKFKSGIYQIFCKGNGRSYIGSAVDLKFRIYSHKTDLNKKRHGNPYLQNAWNKYGCNEFDFIILKYCTCIDLVKEEQYFIDSFDFDRLFNICPIAGNTLGIKYSEEARRKISAAQIGRTPWNKGLSAKTDERVKKQSLILLNHSLSKESKLKISNSLKGIKLSLETRKKLSASLLKRWSTPVFRLKMKQAACRRVVHGMKGRKHSEETKKKMSLQTAGEKNPFFGKRHTEQTKQKISASMTKRIN